ncbi:MAG: hypothetical protein QM528_07830 [Phycisphaerales bacterium]|nr:hypothetical protein [Phycisphaerales bacterium]
MVLWRKGWVVYLNFILVTIEHISEMPSEEGRCKTRRTKCPSKMVKANISKKARRSDRTIVRECW